jgi:hypothetical protein
MNFTCAHNIWKFSLCCSVKVPGLQCTNKYFNVNEGNNRYLFSLSKHTQIQFISKMRI